MIEEYKNITISISKAREWYKSDDKSLREVALQAFTEEELKRYDYEDIYTFKDACEYLHLSQISEIKSCSYLKTFSVQAAAIYELSIIRKALNGGETPSLTEGNIYYPWVRIYRAKDVPNLENSQLVLDQIFEYNNQDYALVGGDYDTYCNRHGIGGFDKYGNGFVNPNVGILACKTKEIAKHMSRHFSTPIFLATFSQYQFVKWK